MNHTSRLDQIEAGLHLLDQGITVFNSDLKMVAWNVPFLRLLDFPASLAFVGADFESFIRYNAERGEYGEGDVEAQIRSRVDAARDTKPHNFERTRPDGQILRIHGEPLPHRGFITLYTDITDQRRYENLIKDQNTELEQRVVQRTEALRRSESQMRLITDTIPALIAYFDSSQTYRYANLGYCNWFNKTADEVIGNSIHNIIGIRAQDSVKHHIARALSGEQVTYEYAMIRNGEKVYARSILVPEIDGAGLIVGCFVLSFDISEQKRMQAALVQAQKMEAIGQLSSGIAHDFNNLLTIVVGNLSILKEQANANPAILNLIEPALEAGKRGAQLVQRLLSFSRQQPLRPTVINIRNLIEDIIPLLQRSLSSRITLSLEFNQEPLIARIDAHQLENALLNLAVNARDAMPDGGSLTIHARRVSLDEAACREYDVVQGDFIRIDVSDSGAGMEPEIQARIFEPFFTTKDFGRGSGLGLSMIYGFAKQSGGGITVTSEPENGTTMSLVLPVHDETPEEYIPASQTGVLMSRSGQLVLLVEDDPDVRQVIRNQLLDLGHPVLEADNSAHALELIRNINDIAIVVTDVIMPGSRNGREMARDAKALRPNLHIVIMSGFEDLLNDKHGNEYLFFSLTKPFSKHELAIALGQP
ncbi:PAS-domain containing protein [Fluviibacter phosphoraccumulans]|uniref:PAS-domain containing protein n=1 Tax=Fluviibacter phosphoraccumulans TaxID=1751046 RepID=UPI0010AF1CC1|nr:PAS-domain containing protein [Fluviibacter phosphoraccumulans]BCA64916.1 signal transduction histidine kinase [Fluviibacter phosphoraccumulans]